MGKRKLALIFSGLMILIALGALFARGLIAPRERGGGGSARTRNLAKFASRDVGH